MTATTHIALLRGINVTGHNKIKMVDLKQLFVDLGYTDVVTYIQSGNVVFKSKFLDGDKMAQEIIESINKVFGYKPEFDLRFIYSLDEFLFNSKSDF